MRWASAISENRDLTLALERCAGSIVGRLSEAGPATLVCVFASAGYGQALVSVPALLQGWFPGAHIVGCSAAGVIGEGREIEDRLAVSITAAHLPGVTITPWHVTSSQLPSPDDPPDAWASLVGVPRETEPDFLILMEPYSAPASDLLAGLDFAFPTSQKAGGMASGGNARDSHLLFLGEMVYQEGAVGLALSGSIVVDTVVAQGCRPIGAARPITRCQGHRLLELDGQSPVEYLQELYQTLSIQDQALVRTSLFLGIAANPMMADEEQPGQFIIRNLLGVDMERGLLSVAEHLREGQLVQFHIRDRATSAHDLKHQLEAYVEKAGNRSQMGALLFQCNGRGTHLYGRAGHDTELFTQAVGPIPMGGLFCNGEIGPVGDTTYLHGFTSSFAIFRKR